MNRPGGPVVVLRRHGRDARRPRRTSSAWKIAYADFVTALMAFFLVMWIIGQSRATRLAIASYFRDPVAFTQNAGGTGILDGAESGLIGGGTPDAASTTLALQRTAARIRHALTQVPDFDRLKDRIDITLADDGLRIELREAPDDGFFDTGSALVKPELVTLLTVIAREMIAVPNKVAIEGHTDRQPYVGGAYTNWELSTDRANAARHVLEDAGLRPNQIDAVRGFADTRLRVPGNPFDAGNRRISIVIEPTGVLVPET